MYTDKDVFGFIELYYSFSKYLEKTGIDNKDLKYFIRKESENSLEKSLSIAEFESNLTRGKMMYDLCNHYDYTYENYNWVNSFRHKEEALEIYKTIENLNGKTWVEKLQYYANN